MTGVSKLISFKIVVITVSFYLFIKYGMISYMGEESSSLSTLGITLLVVLGCYGAAKNSTAIRASKCARMWILWIFWMLLMSILNMFWKHGIASFLHPIFCPCVFLLFFTTTYWQANVEHYFIKMFSIFLVYCSFLCYQISSIPSLDSYLELSASNMVFWPMCCLPFVFLLDNKKLQYVLLLVIVFVVLYCQKRSSTIIILTVAAMMLFDGGTSTRRGWIILIAIVATYFVAQYFMSAYLDNIAYRMRTINEDQGSGRIVLWADIFNALSDNNIIEWIFGRGEGSITQTRHPNAHNDALQLLFEYGIIGVVFYFTFVVRAIKKTIALRQSRSRYFMGYFTCVITIIVMGAVSNLFVFYSFFAFLCAYMGMAEALSAKEENLIIEGGV